MIAIHKIQLFFVSLLALAALALPAASEELPILTAALYAADEGAAASDDSYRAGRRALDDGRWGEAISHFSAVAERGGDSADGATYWKAYALHKQGHAAGALSALAELRSHFPESSWLDDGRALEMEIREAAGTAPRPEDEENEELKLLALNSLMHMESERAVEMLEGFLAGEHSPELKERALFVLGQSAAPGAQEVLIEVARGELHPKLRLRAVQMLGLSGDEHSATLREIYASSTDREVKQAVMHGLMLAGDAAAVLEILGQETDPELRRAAIHQLGLMDATEALSGLYRSETSQEVKQQLLHSMFLAGEAEMLIEIVRTERDPELRRTAVHSLGLTDSEEAATVLAGIYSETEDTEIRQAIIQALFVGDHAAELVAIARAETDPELKRAVVEQLSVMGSEEALEFMMELLD